MSSQRYSAVVSIIKNKKTDRIIAFSIAVFKYYDDSNPSRISAGAGDTVYTKYYYDILDDRYARGDVGLYIRTAFEYKFGVTGPATREILKKKFVHESSNIFDNLEII